MKWYNTAFKDFDKIKKKQNKGIIDFGSRRNKDLFIEVYSDKYVSGSNTKDFLKIKALNY